MRSTTWTTTLLLAAFTWGCGSPPISKELRTARDAYAVAEKGIASELAPAELHLARQALDKAESAFDDDHESQATRDLSYIAERTANLADILGRIEKAKRDRKDFKKKLEKFEKQHANMTREELEAVKVKLEHKKTELATQQNELDKEHSLRVALESKLASALSSLKEVGNVREDARGVVITLSGAVLFTSGNYALLSIAKDQLNQVAKALKDQGYKHIIVEGYTDSRGSSGKNKTLSLRRAESVRTHLIRQGIEASKIVADGMGENRPIATNKTSEGRANNRRVELIVTPE